jgi:hypothetical protein
MRAALEPMLEFLFTSDDADKMSMMKTVVQRPAGGAMIHAQCCLHEESFSCNCSGSTVNVLVVLQVAASWAGHCLPLGIELMHT